MRNGLPDVFRPVLRYDVRRRKIEKDEVLDDRLWRPSGAVVVITEPFMSWSRENS